MDLLSIITGLCEKDGIKIAQLERKMDFGNGTIRKWDKTTPSGDKLAKVADYFNVSVDYLLGREEKTLPDLDRVYYRFAKEAQKLKMDEEDIDNILNIYRKHTDKNR